MGRGERVYGEKKLIFSSKCMRDGWFDLAGLWCRRGCGEKVWEGCRRGVREV